MVSIENFIEIHNGFIKVREATKQGYAIARGGDSINLEQPNSKTRRGRVGKGVANTLTCSCNQGIAINNEKGNDTYMWKNKLEKFNFKMEELQLVSLFSGIGAFEESIDVLGVPTNIKHFAEVEIDAIIDYAAIHIPNFINLEFDYPSDDEMREWLIERNIGWDFEKGKSKIPRLKKDKLYKVYKASILGNNLGDVSLIKYDDFGQVDMIVGGSPCQDFSVAGKQKGSIWTCKECNHQYNPIEQHWSKRDCCPKCESKNLDKTRSSLLVEYLRAVRELKPKYFIYENVKNIKGKGFIKIFNLFEEELKEYGYNTYNKVINAKNNGIPQNRERVFVVGIREDIKCDFHFIEDFDNGVRLKDLIEDQVDEKYYLEKTKAFFIKNSFDMESKGNGFRFEPHVKNNASISKCITTRAGARMDDNFILEGDYESEKFKFDTKNNKIITKEANSYKIRKLTEKECWRLMGFRDESFDKAKATGVSPSSLYKQAGNSIVVNCLYYIFKEIFKEHIIK